MFFHSKIQRQQSRGFGLIELMVSISIMTLVSAIIMTRQSAFNGAVLLRNQAYEVAFALREAQLLAVSGGDETSRIYGVYFDTTTANQRTYRIFRDDNENGTLDTGEQIGLTGQLDSRFEVRGVAPATGSELAVVFTRPNFDARFCSRSGGCTVPGHFSAGPGYIDIARLDVTTDGVGDVRRVQVSDTGQISVVTY
ncbi:MAG: type II secretion system GspH family protein [Candidatus Pacebacteria bacterium]|jgi:prepilin-type N-terminal cleavage/methylation domain-containing protein|nr:type II secretion system GspH family protein [Candidatus Paceibacterota bacterium]